eukprot:s621_g5.t1
MLPKWRLPLALLRVALGLSGLVHLGPRLPLQIRDPSKVSLLGLQSGQLVLAHHAASNNVSDTQADLQISLGQRNGSSLELAVVAELSVAASVDVSAPALASLGAATAATLVAYVKEAEVFLASLDVQAPRVASLASFAAANASSLQLEESGEENLVLSLLMGTRLYACVIHVASDLTVQIVDCADGPEATSCQLISLPGRGFQMFFISPGGDLHVSSLAVSRFQVSWSDTEAAVTGFQTHADHHASLLWGEPLLTNIGDFGLLLTAPSTGAELFAGRLDTSGVLQGETFQVPAANRFAQFGSGALLVVFEELLRLGRRREAGNAAELVLGPAVSQPGATVVASARLGGIYQEAVVILSDGVLLAADYQCEVPESTLLLYDTTNCAGRVEASRCDLGCHQEAVPVEGIARPTVVCTMEGGTFLPRGCRAMACFLPDVVPAGFDASACRTDAGPLRAEDCPVVCRSGADGAVASCSVDQGRFQLAGCAEARCRLPANTTGYDVSRCNTAAGPLPTYQCSVACAVGFAVPVGQSVQVNCEEGEPEFRFGGCLPHCTAPVGITHAQDISCDGGSMVPHRSSCNAACVEGYQPIPAELRCQLGFLIPETFECREASCTVPGNISNAYDPPCEEGSVLLSGTTCTTRCLQGYAPDVAQLSCSKGQLDPESFSCAGLPCAAPTGDEDYATPSCAEGAQIPHGGTCTARCRSGSSPTPRSLQCFVQTMEPRNFTCGKTCNAPSGVANALEPSCAEGALLEHGTLCSPRCAAGFSPLVALDVSLQDGPLQPRCVDSFMQPSTFTCAPGVCAAPANLSGAAEPACFEGWNIGSGGVCTAACQPGFRASPETLVCEATVLTPASFSCRAQGCTAPVDIDNAASPACEEGEEMNHGGSCSPRCRFGYAPSEALLNCEFGTFRPQRFRCSQAAVLGSEVWAVASAGVGGGRAMAAFNQAGKGLTVHLLQAVDGVIGPSGSSKVEAWEQVGGSLVAISVGSANLLIYVRRSSCSSGWEAAFQRIAVSGGRIQAGAITTRALGSEPDPNTAFAGAWLPGLQRAVVALGRQVHLATAASTVQLSTMPALTSTEVLALSISAAGSDKALAVYSDRGCVRHRLALVATGSLSWQAEEELIDNRTETPTCVEGTSVALVPLGSQQLLAVAAAVCLLCAGEVESSGMRWSEVWDFLVPDAGEEVWSVQGAAWHDGGAVFALELTGGSLNLRWADGLGPRSASQQAPSTSSAASFALTPVAPRQVALAYGAFTPYGASDGTLWTLPRKRCRLPEASLALTAYDVSGCAINSDSEDPDGLIFEDECLVRCADPRQRFAARSFCREQDGQFEFLGCDALCQAPAAPGALTPGCREGGRIVIGGVCTSACPEGFAATVPALLCAFRPDQSSLPFLEPRTFSCVPLGCAAPTCTETTAQPTCRGGWHVPHSKLCLPNCLPGYAPTVPYLSCFAGRLEPASYDCRLEGVSCSAPSVLGASNPSCVEGNIIVHGGMCTARCAEALFTATEPTLRCQDGVLTPSTFSCAPPCFLSEAPEQAALPPCAEGLSILHGATCTFRCNFGFEPQPSSARCERGSFATSASNGNVFVCVQVAQDCVAPSSAFHLGIGYVAAPGELCEQLGGAVPHSQDCRGVCPRAGYTPSPTALSCSDGALSPQSFTCGRSCTAAPLADVQFSNPSGACEEGEEIGHSLRCTTSCSAGYVPSVGSLECYDGALSPPSFECRRFLLGCPAPSPVAGGLSPSCAEGSFIPEGSTCTTSCEEAFVPEPVQLRCSGQALSPQSFECLQGCQLAGLTPRGGSCLEGTAVKHGQGCTAQCAVGYAPSVPFLACSRGLLTPTSFDCLRLCNAVIGTVALYPSLSPDWPAPTSGEPACAEGAMIESGGQCRAVCSLGYKPDTELLGCQDGELTPSTFTCEVVRPCFLASAPIGASPPCAEGFTVQHNATCTASCLPGFLPSFEELLCWDGVLTPLTFTCLQMCSAPAVANAPQPCLEGNLLAPGAICTAQCAAGFAPSVPTLTCSESGSGLFTPVDFSCGRTCNAPRIEGALSPACEQLPLRHSQSCSFRCPAGTSSEGEVLCNDGTLVYVGAVSCRLNCQSSENVVGALNPSCQEGAAVPHSGTCNPVCTLGATAVPPALRCRDGRLVAPGYFQEFLTTTITTSTLTRTSRTFTSLTTRTSTSASRTLTQASSSSTSSTSSSWSATSTRSTSTTASTSSTSSVNGSIEETTTSSATTTTFVGSSTSSTATTITLTSTLSSITAFTSTSSSTSSSQSSSNMSAANSSQAVSSTTLSGTSTTATTESTTTAISTTRTLTASATLTTVTVTLPVDLSPSFSCVRTPQLQVEVSGQFHSGGAPTGAVAAALAAPSGAGLAVAFQLAGALKLTIGHQLPRGDWHWGPAATLHDGTGIMQGFRARLASLGGHRLASAVAAAFRDSSGRISLRAALRPPRGLEPALGCALVTGASVDDLQLFASSDGVLWLAYTNEEGLAHISVVRGVGPWRMSLQVSPEVLLSTGVSRMSSVAVDWRVPGPRHAVFLYEVQSQEVAATPLALTRVARLQDPLGTPVLGEAEVLNEGPVLFPDMVALSDGRILCSFVDARRPSSSSTLRMGRLGGWPDDQPEGPSSWSVLSWGERVDAGTAPARLGSFGDAGPVMVVSATSARWLHAWGRLVTLGPVQALAGRVGADATPVALRHNEVALLLPVAGDPSAVHRASLEWTCFLPEDATGYVTTACLATQMPLLEKDCKVSCSDGYLVEGQGPRALCPMPPEAAFFQLSGCVPQPCVAPQGILNAAEDACASGWAVPHGRTCEARCAPGFAPTVARLHCEVGIFQPATFACKATCCDDRPGDNATSCVALPPQSLPCSAPLGVGLAQDPSCAEGFQIPIGGRCRPACIEGYEPTVALLRCNTSGTGELLPATFQCQRQRVDTNSSEQNDNPDAGASAGLFLVGAELRLDIFPVSLSTPASVLAELPAARSALRAASSTSAVRTAAAAALRMPEEQVAVLLHSQMNISSRRLAESEEALSNLTLYSLILGRSNATEVVLQIQELLAGGSPALLFEEALRTSLPELLGNQAPSLLAALADEGTSGWISSLQKLPDSEILLTLVPSSDFAATLPPELDGFLAKVFQEAEDGGDGSALDEEGFPYTDGFLDFLEGIWLLQATRIQLASRLGSGIATDMVLTLVAFLIVCSVVFAVAAVHYRCFVRPHAAFQLGGWDETSYRSVYIIPESHRYSWAPLSQSRFHDATTLCALCCCPCLRMPTTWYRGGVLPYWLGVCACCFFGPICWPCLGCTMRSRMAVVFGIPGSILSRLYIWLCCCCCAAMQESLHVDGALRELHEASKRAAETRGEVQSQLEPPPRPPEQASMQAVPSRRRLSQRLQKMARRAGRLSLLVKPSPSKIAGAPPAADAAKTAAPAEASTPAASSAPSSSRRSLSRSSSARSRSQESATSSRSSNSSVSSKTSSSASSSGSSSASSAGDQDANRASGDEATVAWLPVYICNGRSEQQSSTSS